MGRKLSLIGDDHGQPYKKAGINGHHDLLKALQRAFRNSQVTFPVEEGHIQLLAEKHGGSSTATGGLAFSTRVKSRSAKETKEADPDKLDSSLLSNIYSAIRDTRWLAVPRTMMEDRDFRSNAMVIVPEEHARIPLLWGKTLFPAEVSNDWAPDSTVMFVPDWPGKRQILIMKDIGLTFALGSDYAGEAKKGNLRMIAYFVKRAGMGLAIHGSSKTIYYTGSAGELRTRGIVLVGLSGTGKTSLSGSDHGLVHPEGVENHQDDYVILVLVEVGKGKFIIRVLGSENGYYVKTEDMSKDPSDPLYRAALLPGVVFENVAYDRFGNLVFDDYDTYATRNGRCVIPRRNIANNSVSIDMRQRLYDFYLIYRDPFLAPISLAANPEFGAAAGLALQSIITSAATQDKTQWGKPVFEAFANPFILPQTAAGVAEETLMLYQMLVASGVNVVILNTGEIGFGSGAKTPVDIPKQVSERIIAEHSKGKISFTPSERIPGLLVPEAMDDFNPEKILPPEQFAEKFPAAVGAKRSYVEQFRDYLSQREEGKKILEAFDKAFPAQQD